MLRLTFGFLQPLAGYVTAFVRAHFRPGRYGPVMAFVAVCLALNFGYDLEARFVNTGNFLSRLGRYLLFYGFAWYGALFWQWLGGGRPAGSRQPRFWWLSLSGLLVIALDGSARGTYELARYWFGPGNYLYAGRLLSELSSWVTCVLPLALLWLVTARPADSFYGLTRKGLVLRPYLWLLVGMIPLIALAATRPGFLETYPMCRLYNAPQAWQLPAAWLAAAYELAYGLAFLPTELFFRGFLVIGLGYWLDKDAVLPMVVLYAFLHFEKPLGEAVSSVFGGYLLGIFAYYSRNIWGGVIVHTGIALLMELAAWLAKS